MKKIDPFYIYFSFKYIDKVRLNLKTFKHRKELNILLIMSALHT